MEYENLFIFYLLQNSGVGKIIFQAKKQKQQLRQKKVLFEQKIQKVVPNQI